jgi:hypothetical protein
MTIRTLECALNKKKFASGPQTNSFYSQYVLTDEETRLYEKLALLPKPHGIISTGKSSKKQQSTK